jgi:hypothetical protein
VKSRTRILIKVKRRTDQHKNKNAGAQNGDNEGQGLYSVCQWPHIRLTVMKSRIQIRIRINVKSRIRIRIKMIGRIPIHIKVMQIRISTSEVRKSIPTLHYGTVFNIAGLWIRITLMRIRILTYPPNVDPGCGSGLGFLFAPDPDPTFYPDADPDSDPSFQMKASNFLKSTQIGSYSIHFDGFKLMRIRFRIELINLMRIRIRIFI